MTPRGRLTTAVVREMHRLPSRSRIEVVNGVVFESGARISAIMHTYLDCPFPDMMAEQQASSVPPSCPEIRQGIPPRHKGLRDLENVDEFDFPS